jgi:putative glutamine amidotransferase
MHMPSKPVIGIPACRREIGAHVFHIVGEKYIAAVEEGAGATPLILPALGERLDLADVLARVDGLLFTGSLSNVEPRHYGGSPSIAGTLHDPERDRTTLPLIRDAVSAGVPVFAICRGFQEMNVAFGGTLHQRVHEEADHMDHREDKDDPLDVQYGPVHRVRLAPSGLLARLAGTDEIMVNSLHSQGVDRLAPSLVVEATADDGLIEGFRVDGRAPFALGVQWHPEWKFKESAFSRRLFEAFGEASRRYQATR